MEKPSSAPSPPPIVLTLSGSDPSGGAGLEADLKTFHQHGVYGMAVPTLLTVQNTTGVRKVKSLEPDFLEEQVDFLLEDLFPSVIKIGSIGSRSMLQALVRLLSQNRLQGVKVVVDTVMHSTSGAGLFDMRGLPDFMDRLLPLAYLVTPNLPEFELLTGKKTNEQNAAAHLLAFGREKPYSLLLKGGHFSGAPSDYLYHAGTVKTYPGRRIDTAHTHGTGCALSSAIAANLALGFGLPDSVARARLCAGGHRWKSGTRARQGTYRIPCLPRVTGGRTRPPTSTWSPDPHCHLPAHLLPGHGDEAGDEVGGPGREAKFQSAK